ncbi:Crp/Fnr family transcriptional regulator [Huintestinicola sp.]|uniref:Crp/Fnr family transcriptional regulator n=1 Tax=Huintestinicola sp. TaxID=2981661 RepID=UPI003D7EBF91
MGSLLSKQELIYLKNRFNARSVKYDKNETVLHIDESSNQMCFVLEGMVYLCAEDEQCERSILRFFRTGEFFSSAMLVPPEYAVSYMTAKYPSEVVFFSREEIFRFCSANPDWMTKFLQLIPGQSGREVCINSFILHQRSIRSKLLFFFRQESRLQGGSRIRLPLPFTDLAEFLACDRSAMMKELSKMKGEGLISGKNREIVINESLFRANPEV